MLECFSKDEGTKSSKKQVGIRYNFCDFLGYNDKVKHRRTILHRKQTEENQFMAEAKQILVKIPSTEKKAALVDILENDENFNFARISIDKDTPTFQWLNPTEDNEFNKDSATSFYAVVLLARKNNYQSPEDREAGKEVKEKRELYILRAGKLIPEKLYVSATSVRNWQYYCAAVKNTNSQYFYTFCKFSVNHVKGKLYTWNAPKFEISRTLTEDERTYIDELRPLVASRVKQYVTEEQLAACEDEVLSGYDKVADPEVAEQKHVANKVNKLEEDHDEPVKVQVEPTPEVVKAKVVDPVKATAKPGYPSLDEDDLSKKTERRVVALEDED